MKRNEKKRNETKRSERNDKKNGKKRGRKRKEKGERERGKERKKRMSALMCWSSEQVITRAPSGVKRALVTASLWGWAVLIIVFILKSLNTIVPFINRY